MSVSRFAADALVHAYLHGRTLPEGPYRAALSVAEERLVAGEMPVIDAALRRKIDDEAVASPGPMRRGVRSCTQPKGPHQSLWLDALAPSVVALIAASLAGR